MIHKHLMHRGIKLRACLKTLNISLSPSLRAIARQSSIEKLIYQQVEDYFVPRKDDFFYIFKQALKKRLIFRQTNRSFLALG